MDLPANKHQSQLSRIKETVKKSYDYFKPNYDRYNEFRRFVFDTSLKEEDVTLMMTLSKPTLEFNVLEAYISRLLGEFSKQMPDIEVSSENDQQVDPMMVELVEQHLRHFLSDANNHHTKYEVYKDLLSGGFSVFKMTTDYANPMSFNQIIKFERAFDPTLCGFDMLARFSHKGDGQFCFELCPMSEDEFKECYPDIPLDQISFRRDFAGFNWAYMNGNVNVILVCDFYEKKKKNIKIVQLRDGRVMPLKKYEEEAAQHQGIEAFPGIVGKPRMTQVETICRYRLIENKIIEYVETDFTMLPLIFVDGSSVMIRTQKNANVRQMTRPYVYHAKGAQKLKNFAGISLANEIENMVQHKFKVSKESLPKEEEFLQAYKDVQKASVLVYNEFFEQNPDARTTPPQEINRIQTPPEVVQAFVGADSLIQNILGSYDSSLGINDNQLSGIAIIESATQSNAAAMPYVVGFLQGLQRVAECYIDLMPKYYKTPRTIPVLDEDGKRGYVKINQQGGIPLEYDDNVLNVKVTAGASFQIQKSKALQQIVALQQSSPMFQQFMATKGLPILLDNIDIRGIDKIKEEVDEWEKEMKQQQQMQMQMAQQQMQQNPQLLKAKNDQAKIALEGKKHQDNIQLDLARLQQDQEKLMVDMQMQQSQNKVQLVKAQTERFSKAVDAKMAHTDMTHKHTKEAIGVAMEHKDMEHRHQMENTNERKENSME